MKSRKRLTAADLKRAIERLVGEPSAWGFDGIPTSALDV
jgi:hypothetical protein